MVKTTLLSALIATMFVGAAPASDDKYKENYDASTSEATQLADADIRTMLEQQGYRIVKIERERNKVEVYAKKDGRRWEIEMDSRSGRILELEEKY